MFEINNKFKFIYINTTFQLHEVVNTQMLELTDSYYSNNLRHTNKGLNKGKGKGKVVGENCGKKDGKTENLHGVYLDDVEYVDISSGEEVSICNEN